MIKKIIDLILLMLFYNLIPLWTELNFPVIFKIIMTLILSVIFITELFRNEKIPVKSSRLGVLKRGTSLVWISGMAVIPEIVIIVFYFTCSGAVILPKIFSIVMPLLTIAMTFFDGFIRIAVSSKQIKIIDYILLVFFWWLPVINLILICY